MGKSTAAVAPYCGLDCGSIVPGKEACLQLSDRIPAVDFCQRRIACHVMLESKLVKSLFVERACPLSLYG